MVASSYMRAFNWKKTDGSRLSIATARAGNVIGGGDWALNRIVPDCARACLESREAEIRSPHATRPWQHVLEPLSGYLWLGAQLAEQENLHGESFNFGPPADTTATVEELLKKMQKTWEPLRWRVTEAGLKGKEAQLLKLSCDKAFKFLKWQATLTFSETVQMTAEWYKDYGLNPSGSSELTLKQIRHYESLAASRDLYWAIP